METRINTDLALYIEPDDEVELEDDILVTFDYYYNNYIPTTSTPEIELAKGILIFSIIDYLSDSKAKKGAYNDARKWFFHEEPVDYIFSFVNICALMEIDSSRFRERLKKRKKSKAKFIVDGKRIN